MRQGRWYEQAYGYAQQRGCWLGVVRRCEGGWSGGVLLATMLGRTPMPADFQGTDARSVRAAVGRELGRLTRTQRPGTGGGR